MFAPLPLSGCCELLRADASMSASKPAYMPADRSCLGIRRPLWQASPVHASRSLTQAMNSVSEMVEAASFSIVDAVAIKPSGGWEKVASLRSMNSRITS